MALSKHQHFAGAPSADSKTLDVIHFCNSRLIPHSLRQTRQSDRQTGRKAGGLTERQTYTHSLSLSLTYTQTHFLFFFPHFPSLKNFLSLCLPAFLSAPPPPPNLSLTPSLLFSPHFLRVFAPSTAADFSVIKNAACPNDAVWHYEGIWMENSTCVITLMSTRMATHAYQKHAYTVPLSQRCVAGRPIALREEQTPHPLPLLPLLLLYFPSTCVPTAVEPCGCCLLVANRPNTVQLYLTYRGAVLPVFRFFTGLRCSRFEKPVRSNKKKPTTPPPPPPPPPQKKNRFLQGT